MSEALSLNRQFAVEMHSRAIDTCNDIEELRKVAKTLLSAWQMQADFSERFGAELLGLKRAGCQEVTAFAVNRMPRGERT